MINKDVLEYLKKAKEANFNEKSLSDVFEEVWIQSSSGISIVEDITKVIKILKKANVSNFLIKMALKKSDIMYNLYEKEQEEILNLIPTGIKETVRAIEEIKKRSKKFPSKPYKLKEATEKNFDITKLYFEVVHKGKKLDFTPSFYEDLTTHGYYTWQILYQKRYWNNFNEKEAIDILIKKGIEHVLILILEKDSDWNEESKNKVMQYLANTNIEMEDFYFPRFSKITIERIKNLRMRYKSRKFPSKPYKLKEDMEDFFSMSPRQIFHAGESESHFNYEKGLNALIQQDKIGDWIYFAGNNWPQFDYEKGLNALKNKLPEYYKKALEYWPKDIRQTQQMIDELKKRSQKFPNKPLKLKEDNDTFNMVKEIIEEFNSIDVVYQVIKVQYKYLTKEEKLEIANLIRKKFLDNWQLTGKGKEVEYYYDQIMEHLIPIQYTQSKISKVKEKAQKFPSKPYKLGESKMSLRDFIDDKEEQEFDLELNENIFSVIGTVLGYTLSAGILAFGGTLLILGGKKYVLKMKDLWQKILGAKKKEEGEKEITPDEVMREIETDVKVKAEKMKVEEKRRTYEDQLREVYTAIEEKDFDRAKEEFYKVERNLQNNPDVHKAIMAEITKVMKEPPLYVKSPGNGTYQAIKKIINIRVARASAKATEMALANAAGIE